MCGAPLKSIRKQLLPGVVFRNRRGDTTVKVLGVYTDRMEVKLEITRPFSKREVITRSIRGWSDNYLSGYVMLTFPKELRLEDVL